MSNFIINNLGFIVVIIVTILSLFQAIISKNKQQIYANIYSLISDAEELEGASGLDKFKYVFDAAYGKLPKLLKFFISEDDIKRAIEYSLNKLKKYANQELKA